MQQTCIENSNNGRFSGTMTMTSPNGTTLSSDFNFDGTDVNMTFEATDTNGNKHTGTYDAKTNSINMK